MRVRMFLAIAIALTAIGVGLWWLIPQNVKEPWPFPLASQVVREADRFSTKGGESELIDFSLGSQLSWVTRLQKVPGVVEWPYAGIKISLGDSLGRGCVDWSHLDTLRLRLSSSLAFGFSLGIDTKVPDDLAFPDAGKMRRIQMAVPSSREIRDYSIALKDLQVPQWWKEQYKLSLLDNRGFLESVCAVNLINTSDLQRLDEIDTTLLLSASLTGRTPSNPWGALFVLLGTLVLMLPLWRPHEFGLVPAPAPSPVLLRDHGQELTERIATWYNDHYMDGDLTMAEAARAIGVHPKKLQLLLRSLFQTTHKTRLKELRLMEASRLLKESDNPVGEIALSVGYNTVSHFNRSFKEHFGLSPLEHRTAESKQQPDPRHPD